MGKKLDLTSRVFDRLTVLHEAKQRHPDGLVSWECRCDCGALVVVSGSLLSRGRTKSCGCLQRDSIKLQNSERDTHRLSRTAIYAKWRAMVRRCHDPRTRGYASYGARGIKVCDRWRDFDNFFSDMGLPPTGRSLDRINNDGDYEPSNCRWATSIEQANNRRTNVCIVFNGESMTLKRLSVVVGVNRMTLYWRYKQGWRLPELICPPQKR